MRMLLKVCMCPDTFNAAVKKGTVGKTLKRIIDAAKAEAVYFTEIDGMRTAILIVDVADATQIPAYAEPWFLALNATVEFHPVMTVDDLAKAGLESLGKKWA